MLTKTSIETASPDELKETILTLIERMHFIADHSTCPHAYPVARAIVTTWEDAR